MDSCAEFVKRYCTKATPIPTNRHRTCSFSQSRCASRSRARERVSRTVLLNCFSRRKRWRCCLALLVINFLPERKRDLIEAVGALDLRQVSASVKQLDLNVGERPLRHGLEKCSTSARVGEIKLSCFPQMTSIGIFIRGSPSRRGLT